MRRRMAFGATLAAFALVFASAPTAASAADEPCVVTACTVTFTPALDQQSWVVPDDIVELSAIVAGAAGVGNRSASGGPGGVVVVALNSSLAGSQLHLLVGAVGQGSQAPTSARPQGGGGTYLATSDTFLVVSGGGGGAGNWVQFGLPESPSESVFLEGEVSGGTGGAAAGGTDGSYALVATSPGRGATPTAAGLPGEGYSDTYRGTAGTAATVTSGVITPGLGGAAGFTSGAGGGWYFGGGGGSNPASTNDADGLVTAEYGSGGGGSGYLAPSLVAASTATNTGEGFVTLEYRLAADEPELADTGSADAAGIILVSGLLLTTGTALMMRRSRRATA